MAFLPLLFFLFVLRLLFLLLTGCGGIGIDQALPVFFRLSSTFSMFVSTYFSTSVA